MLAETETFVLSGDEKMKSQSFFSPTAAESRSFPNISHQGFVKQGSTVYYIDEYICCQSKVKLMT